MRNSIYAKDCFFSKKKKNERRENLGDAGRIQMRLCGITISHNVNQSPLRYRGFSFQITIKKDP